MRRLFAGIAAAIVTAASLVFSSPVANAAASDLVIKNASYSTGYLYVCRNWGNATCRDAWRILLPGENTKTKFGWADADGVLLQTNKRYYNSNYSWGVWNSCGGSQVSEKRAGAWGGTETWSVYKC